MMEFARTVIVIGLGLFAIALAEMLVDLLRKGRRK